MQQIAQKKERDELEEIKKSAVSDLERAKAIEKEIESKLEEKVKQISLLEQERQDNVDKLTKREKDLFKYKYKIKDLQKSKHVLTHRTTEMKASL